MAELEIIRALWLGQVRWTYATVRGAGRPLTAEEARFDRDYATATAENEGREPEKWIVPFGRPLDDEARELFAKKF
jgi:hypothetical protein